MCPNRKWFTTYQSTCGSTVLTGNDNACKAVRQRYDTSQDKGNNLNKCETYPNWFIRVKGLQNSHGNWSAKSCLWFFANDEGNTPWKSLSSLGVKFYRRSYHNH